MATARRRSKSAEGFIALDAALVIRHAAQLHARLGAALACTQPVVLEAAAVTHVDTAGLQLLEAFVDARTKAGRPCRWSHVGEALRDAAARLGMESMLGLPEPATDPAAG